MQAPAVLSDTPMENEEAVYPCKGCNEILEEGKAFELAGNRWHIDCFRCNTCGTLLDSDANLLLLGDGSLICNNCTYSCSACGNKIEDLAILTGDQAFCANCFKCRNCKRKIDNLRYARTSQGIFCMQCHESLMARRRKRGKGIPRTVSTNSTGSGGPIVLDKSLPALPPHVLPTSAFPITSEANTPESYEALAERSPTFVKKDVSFPPERELSPTTTEGRKENLVLPPSTYNDGNPLLSSQNDHLTAAADDGFFIPVTLDTDIVPPLSKSRRGDDQASTRDYLGGSGKHTSVSAMKDDFQDLVAGSSRSGSHERNQARQRRSPLATSHIASQQRGRKSSADGAPATSPITTEFDRTRLSPSYESSDPVDKEGFRLQDAPKERPKRPTASRENSYRSFRTATSPSLEVAPQPTVDVDFGSTSPGYFETFESTEPKRKSSLRRARSPIPSGGLGGLNPFDRPAREDSLLKTQKQAVTRKEVPRPELEPAIDPIPSRHERKPSGSSMLGKQESKLVPSKSLGRPFAPSITSTLVDGPPARSPRRPASTKPEDDVDGPNQIRALAGQHGHRQTASVSSIQSEHFSTHDTEEGAQEGHESGGLFRKVSKAVRHGRSHSDKLNPAPSPKWKRNGSADISSPIMPAPGSSEEIIQLRNKLRVTQLRVTELETDKMELQEKVNGTVDLRQINVELRDKRSTMAFLDSQREMVIRELEVMTEHLAKVKDSNLPLDMDNLQAVVIRDFSSALQKLKDSTGTQIEELMRKKNDTTNQITALMQMKDKVYQEYEALNTKNNQLSEVNSQLVQNIQETYKQNRQPGAPPPYANNAASAQNGLGIYTNNNRDMDIKNPLTTTDSAMSQYSGETEVDSTNMLNAPKVVDIRKGQPQKKFNWKKGGQSVAKGVSKGFKGAFGGTQNSTLREEQFAEGVPYGSLQSGELPISGNVPFNQSRAPLDTKQWGFLAAQKGGANKAGAWAQSSASSLAAVDPSTLFGSDLSARCDFEKRIVPSMVLRCIEEVELRGIALEGIYRKSGSASQVKAIQAGFEKDHLHNDISDPDLDIHAVTSTLKQYFRKLPNPLITFEAYDSLIEAMEGATTPGGRDADEERAMRVREVLDMLPRSHRETLEFLIEHLVRVMENESENLMTPLNIAVVFAPTIMRPQSIEREMTDMQSQRHAVQLMLEQSRICFGSDD